jgi:LysM repeat protein
MDTISRENNSMLPVGGIIVGVIALLLGGFAAIKVSGLSKTVADNQASVDSKLSSVESQASAASAAADKAGKDVKALRDTTQEAFNTVGPELARLQGAITKIEEAQKKPAPVADKKGGGGPVVAAPGEYIIKAGDTFAKIARAQGVTIADMTAVNPGVSSSALKVGQKIKLPKK